MHDLRNEIKELFVFNTVPQNFEIEQKAIEIVKIAKDSGQKKILIGGESYYISVIEISLIAAGLIPYFKSIFNGKEELVSSSLNIEEIIND